MTKNDSICYLNLPPNTLLIGNLGGAIESLPAKMQKAPPAQWINTIKSLVSKGVKQAEIDDCDVLTWLGANPAKSLERAQIQSYIASHQVTIKEVVLGQPRFQSHSHASMDQSAIYREILFIANSERANMEDRIEELEWELEQFAFEPERMATEAGRVMELEFERASLMREKPKAYDFNWSHFEAQTKRHGRNLLAHGRELVAGPTYLIEEVQSDWGQQGRRKDWVGIARAPFVTDTKLWAGLVARRMIQRAAVNPEIRQVFWIRGSMSNGGQSSKPSPLDDFYLKTVPSIIDKALAGTGEKSRLETLRLGGVAIADVPCFDMTDKVRERLVQSQPLYSLSGTFDSPNKMSLADRTRILQRARHLIGSVRHVRLVAHLYDLHTMRQVSGSYMNGVIQIALSAKQPTMAMDHECFHFAHERLLSAAEREIVERDFAPGARLNRLVHDTLMRRGDVGAAAQCSSATEAAAHGFALWASGALDLDATGPVQGIFAQIRVVMQDVLAWVRGLAQNDGCKSVEDVFRVLDDGTMAERVADRNDAHRREAIRA